MNGFAERAVSANLVLKGVDDGDIGWVGRVGEDPHSDQDVRGVELLNCQLEFTRVVEHAIDVVILIHDHHRQIAASTIRNRQRGTHRNVNDRQAVERVTVHPDHCLVVKWRGRPMVEQRIHTARVSLKRREHPVSLCSDEILVVDLHRIHLHPLAVEDAAPMLAPSGAR